jgi:DNA polymerase-1
VERLHILDGYGYIFRAFYGLVTGGPGGKGVRLTTRSGMPTGALYVYARMLIRLYKDVKPERIAVVFDAPGKTFRDELDERYKATRRETPDDLQVQMPYFRPLTEAFCWPVLSVEGVEADDVIATLVARARAQDWEVVIYSADKDLMQLIEPHVQMIDSMRQVTYDAARVSEKFGVPPAQVRDWLALVGDTSDNVPGMPGVGKKTAAKLLDKYGDLDGILAHVGEMKGKQKERFTDPELIDQLKLSRELVTLKADVDLPVELADLVPAPWDGTRLAELLSELEFQALLDSLGGQVAAAAAEVEPEVPAFPAPIAVSSAGELEPVIAAARAAGRIALHVETDGPRPELTRLVGLAVAAEGAAPAYVPLSHRYLGVPAQLSADALPEALTELFSDPEIEVVCHDGKSARRALRTIGIELTSVGVDTMLAAYLLDEPSSLVEVASRFGDATVVARTDLVGKGKSAIEFESVAVPEAASYAGNAAAALLRARPKLEQALDRSGQLGLLRDLEQPLAMLLADLEDRGITLDVDHLRSLSDRVGGQIATLERRAFELAGEEINLGSPKQLSALLFDRLGLKAPRMKKTKTGYSTDHEVLESMVDLHPIIRPILEHRELIKLKGTYIDALPPLVNPASGRLHTSFNQAVAATGRLSSQDPNLQNIPIRSELGRDIRRAFVAADDKLLVSADYSQIELRILAHLSEDPVLLRAFREGIDVHTQTAAEVFGIPLDEVGAHERRVAKAVNYGLAYGQSDFGLGRALDIPRKEARFYIDTYFERFSRVKTFMEELIEKARREGAATTVLGRRRPIPEIHSKNYQRRSAAERMAQNTPMQGSGADILKLAMLEVERRLVEISLGADMLLTVHDELVFEADADQAEEVGDVVKEVMEGVYELSVPLVVDVGIGRTWADAH